MTAAASANAAGPRYGTLVATPQARGLEPRRSMPLAKRDDTCGEGRHSCLDVKHGNACCDNDSYCYVNGAGDARCCPIGSNCVDDSPCRSDAFFCTASTTARGGRVQTGVVGCCRRACPQTSHYLCPEDRGGRCCPYGATCRAGGNCVETVTSPPERPTLGTDPVRGAGQAPAVARLSDGARAGIGVSAGVTGGMILGVAAWLCVSKRRERRRGGWNGPAPGRAEDYFGPYTETRMLPDSSARAVSPRREGPAYTAAPVEMYSPTARGSAREPPSLGRASPPRTLTPPPPETVEGRSELYDSESAAHAQPPPSLLRAPRTPRSEGTRAFGL